MSAHIYYSKSPLIEAVIDIQVELPEEFDSDILLRLAEGKEREYPEHQKLYEGRLEFNGPETEPVTRSVEEFRGYIFVSDKQHQAVESRLNGFAFSRRGNYENWSSFKDEAQHWWERYRQLAQPVRITRLAVRYINRLELPLPIKDFRDYLRVVPDIALDLPQSIASYFLQLHIPQPDTGFMLILNQALADFTHESLGIILDIDLFLDHDVPQDEQDIWNTFAQLRTQKNDIFEKCITEQMKEMIR